MTRTRPTVHIVGGGIGGLALAVALTRRGWPVHVYEAAASYAQVGGGHWLYANALHALEGIDPEIAADLVALGHPFTGFCFRTHAGRVLLLEGTAPYTPRPALAPVVLRRADIIDRLAARVPPERLHFGKRLDRIDAATLHFVDGTTVHAPLLIGADGIHSIVRRDRLGGHGPRSSGQTGLWGISAYSLPDASARHFTEMWGDGVRMGFTAVGDAAVYWFMVVRDERVPTDPDARKAYILARGAAFPPELVEAVRRTPAAGVHINPLYDMDPLPRWWAPGVCGLGDAVHACTPNLGQGGCQALEDALALAELLDEHPETDAAFEAFQAARYRRVTAITFLARWLGAMAQLRGPIRLARNALVWLTPAAALRPLLRWIMGVP